MDPVELAIIRCNDAISNKAMITFIQASSGGGPGTGSCRDIPYNLTPEQSKPVFEALKKALHGL